MKNVNRAMFEETGLIIGDEVDFKGETWEVRSASFIPKTTNLHCVSLIRAVDGGSYTTAVHSNQFGELRLIEAIDGE